MRGKRLFAGVVRIQINIKRRAIMEFGKKIKYDIIIKASGNNGFIVTVGCGQFVFPDKESLLRGLDYYLSNPDRCEQAYNENCAFGPPVHPDAERLQGSNYYGAGGGGSREVNVGAITSSGGSGRRC